MANQPKQQHGKAAGTKNSKLYSAQTRRTNAQAEMEELKLRQIKGELVERAAVQKATFAHSRRVRDGLQNVAARISGLVAAESDQARCFAIISKEIAETLEGLAG